MQVDYEFMKNSYKCIKEETCDKCSAHSDQMVLGKERTVNNVIYFCPSPVKKQVVKRGATNAQKGKKKK